MPACSALPRIGPGRRALLAALFALPLGAAVAGAAGEKLRFDRLALAEGLSQASANDVIEDRHGFLWVATQEGLNLWDGYAFEHFKRDPADPSSLAKNFSIRLWAAQDGTIWVLHEGGRAISLLDPDTRTFRRLQHDPEDETTLAPASQFSGEPVVDERGRVWVATFDAGVNVVDPASLRVTRLRHDEEDDGSLAADRIRSLRRTSDGMIWLATENGLQRRLEPQADGTERFRTYRHDPEDPTSLPADVAFGLLEDPDDGRLWVGGERGLARWDPASDRFERFLQGEDYPPWPEGDPPGGNPFAVPGFVDRRGWLWVGTRGGTSVLERPSGRVRRHYQVDRGDPHSLSSRNIQDFHEDAAGELWIATGGGGLNRYAPEIDGFDVYVHDPADPHSLSSDLVNRIYESPSGMLWFGTFSGGLTSYSRAKQKFHRYGRDPRGSQTLADEAVFAIHVDRAGTLWVGTQVGGLHRYSADRRRVTERYFANPGDPRDLGSNYVQALYEDRAGRLWVATGGGGLALLDRERGRVARRYVSDPDDESSISSNGVQVVYEDSQGTFWVAVFGALEIFDPETGRFEHIEHDPENPDRSLPQTNIRIILEDREGRIWLGTGAGLCQIDRTSHEVSCRSNDPRDPSSLSNDTVMALHESEDGALWVATYGGGLNRFDPERGTFTQITTREGLPNDSIYSVVPDREGGLWLSTNRGLARFDPRSGEVRAYDAEDGLQSNEFNDRSFFASADGELFFGGIHGFNSFRPEELAVSDFVPPVVLTSFRKLGPEEGAIRVFDGVERVVIRHRDLGFAFEFAALDFASPERNRYAYRLEGFDRNWIESGNRRFASYTNLDGGTYTFRVRGTNADGIWNEEGTSIQVVVIPPPWKTWWAYSLYAMAVMGGILGYVRIKTYAQQREVERHREEAERLKQIDRMKDEFLANTSHELRTPLNGIIGITESVLDGAAGEVTEAARQNLEMVSASGRRLAHLVDDILDFSKLRGHEIVLRLRPVALREVVDVTLTLSRGLVGGRALELVNEVDPGLPRVSADEDRLQQILHNLVGNAIKFTREGVVRVSARREEDRVLVAVEDTGVGIAADKLERIFESFQQADASSAREFGGTGLGLTISRQLVELHGGTITVDSAPGEGSIFTFSLPVWEGAIDAAATPEQRPLARVRDSARPVAAPVAPAPPTPAPASPTAPALAALAVANDEGARERSSARVLCVDDEPVNLQVLENILSLEGYQVERANDGLECLELLRRGLLPDIVLLDVMMPRMTGFEVARRIRESFPAPRLPILMVTAKNQVDDLVEGLSSGANDYLSKPFSKLELLARVETHLSLARASSIEAENRRKSEEMKQARAIQLSLLPKAPPEHSRYELAAHLETATEVGGDYYDFFPQSDGSLFVVTGDATGHGISAGMMVSMTKSALKALDVSSPENLLTQLNGVMRAVELTRMQMALNVVHLLDGQARISSAAMPPAILYRAASRSAEEVLLPGLPLGAMGDAVYGLAELEFRSGDALVLLSDGLPELVDRREGVDGYAEMLSTVRRHGAGTARELVDALAGLIDASDHPLRDDVTVVVVKRR